MSPLVPGSPHVGRAAVLGLGLMGGSLALALRAAMLCDEIVGFDPAAGVTELALARGMIDRACEFPAEATRTADMIVLATPTQSARMLLQAISAQVGPQAIVTDVCSVKAPVVAWANAALVDPSRFVGGHPMAGSERSGLDAANATLYQGARWLLTPTASTAPDALALVEALVRALGAIPQRLDPAEHDVLLAGASHLPMALAAALAVSLAEAPDWPGVAQVAAGGYRDTTRIAAGDPVMARDICLSNPDALLARLDAYQARLGDLRTAIAQGDRVALTAFFRASQQARQAWEQTRQTGAEKQA
ncbi:MAG: prephenate dehydrogenase/arogenate dehydrogenase family protein [Ktedonobacterales bacterium]